MQDFDKKEALAVLEKFLVDNEDLYNLEQRANRFNIFEAVSSFRHELRHSDFLSYLLDPACNHGIGSAFLRRFVRLVLSKNENSNLRPAQVELISLDSVEVRREWERIDILLVYDLSPQFVIAIENKIDTREHSNQLAIYKSRVLTKFPFHEHFFVYLTPTGDEPSEQDYVPVSYPEILKSIEMLMQDVRLNLFPEIKLCLQHYVDMVRRHIVPDPEIIRLCRQIYNKHKQAIDLIVEHLPDLQGQISEFLIQLIKSNDKLILDNSGKGNIRFAPKEWECAYLSQGSGWTQSGRILLFEFRNAPTLVELRLYIGPGPSDVRQDLQSLCLNHPFSKPKSITQKWSTIYKRHFLKLELESNNDVEDIRKILSNQWLNFLEFDFVSITQQVVDFLKINKRYVSLV